MSSRLDSILGRFRPVDYARYELVIMRVLFALVIWRVLGGSMRFGEQPHPVGLAKWFGVDFTFFADPSFVRIARPVLFGCLAVYCSGFLNWLSLPVILFLLVGSGTLGNSQGAATHSTQLVTLCILTQCAWHLYAAISARRGGGSGRTWLEVERLSVWFTQQTIAAAYIVSAISKWVAKGDWVRDSYQFPLQVIKSQNMDYYNSLQPAGAVEYRLVSELVEPISGFLCGIVGRLLTPPAQWIDGAISGIVGPIARWMEAVMMSHPGWAPLLVAPGFFLELFAFLLLGGRKLGAAVAILLIFFHLTVAEMMNLNFKFNIYLLATLFLSVPFYFASLGRKTLAMTKSKLGSDDG